MSAASSEYIKSKLESFFAALARFEESMAVTTGDAAILRDARIQRFEFCYDLAWKTNKAVLEALGLEPIRNPNASFKKAMQQGYIPLDQEPIWLQMIEHRNTTAHVYDLEQIQAIATYLPSYAVLLRTLAERLRHVYLEDIPKQ